MTYRSILVHLLIIGYSLCWVTGQESNVAQVRLAVAGAHRAGDMSQGANEEEEISVRLQNVTTIEDFVALLEKNGNPVGLDEIVSNYTDEAGRIHINEGGRLAVPDDCSPRDTTVRLTFDNSNPNMVYFPRCTKIERCGGCCATPNLECVPSYTERVSYKVIKAEVPHPGSGHLEWKGQYEYVILDRHVNCRVQCTLTPDKCGPKKEFKERQCECKCRLYERCQPPRVWDPEECECKCAEVFTCCKDGEMCGLIFMKDTCECGIDVNVEYILSRPNITQGEIDAYFALLNSSMASTTLLTSSSQPLPSSSLPSSLSSLLSSSPPLPPSSSSSPPPLSSPLPSSSSPLPSSSSSSSTTATSTVTTETTATTVDSAMTTESDPCPTVNCPRGFSKQLNSAGNCTCRRSVNNSRSRSRSTFLP